MISRVLTRFKLFLFFCLIFYLLNIFIYSPLCTLDIAVGYLYYLAVE